MSLFRCLYFTWGLITFVGTLTLGWYFYVPAILVLWVLLVLALREARRDRDGQR